ncbi:hypothetical protein OH77DRAFT_710272 [Trametes cingulata]|nr:hypothetical protein OH77DRAFT_710272 [Trametes cingulata]
MYPIYTHMPLPSPPLFSPSRPSHSPLLRPASRALGAFMSWSSICLGLLTHTRCPPFRSPVNGFRSPCTSIVLVQQLRTM